MQIWHCHFCLRVKYLWKMCCLTFESWAKAWTWSGKSAASTITQSWKASSRPAIHSWTSYRGTPRHQRYPAPSSPSNPQNILKINMQCTSVTAPCPLIHNQSRLQSRQHLQTLPPLSSLLILGSLQQCGELLWRERQDDSTLCVLPRVCALHQGLQGEGDKLLTSALTGCSAPLLDLWEAPWFVVVLGESRSGQGLAACVPQDVACSPRPNNRKGQLDLTLELQLWCLDCPAPPSFPLPPDSRALPHHTAHFLTLFSAWIYGICSRKWAT